MVMRGTQRPLSRIALFLMVSFTLLSACTEATPKNAVPMTTLAATEATTPTIAPTARSSRTVPPSAAPEATTSPIPLTPPNPKIDYPLALGNSWVYQFTRYLGYPSPDVMTTTRVITETVAEVLNTSPYSVVKVREDWSAEMPVVIPKSWESLLMRPAESDDYWLVHNGGRLYRQDNKLDLSILDQALVKFVFPLEIGNRWALTENQTKMLPAGKKPGMTRQVVRRGTVDVPAGRFSDCYFLREEWAGFILEDWFCPNVGIVESKADHQGTPEGWHRVLIRYELE